MIFWFLKRLLFFIDCFHWYFFIVEWRCCCWKFWFWSIFDMKFRNQILRVVEIIDRISFIVRRIIFSFDFIMQFIFQQFEIQTFFDFVFFFFIDYHERKRWLNLIKQQINDRWFQQCNIKNVVNFHWFENSNRQTFKKFLIILKNFIILWFSFFDDFFVRRFFVDNHIEFFFQ